MQKAAFVDGKLAVVQEVERGAGQPGWLAVDGHIYRQTTGALSAVVPMTPEQYAAEWGTVAREPTAVLHSWEASVVPPGWVLRWLWERLLRRFSGEVGVLLGRTDAGKWVFVVPEQQVTHGSVEFDDPVAPLTMWGAGATVLGSVHKHPGRFLGYSGSGGDLDAYGEMGGIHVIVTEDGTAASVHGSAAGWVWTLIPEMALEGERPEGACCPQILTSGGRKLAKIVRVPPPRVLDWVVGAQEPSGEQSLEDLWDDQDEDSIPWTEPVGRLQPADIDYKELGTRFDRGELLSLENVIVVHLDGEAFITSRVVAEENGWNRDREAERQVWDALEAASERAFQNTWTETLSGFAQKEAP